LAEWAGCEAVEEEPVVDGLAALSDASLRERRLRRMTC